MSQRIPDPRSRTRAEVDAVAQATRPPVAAAEPIVRDRRPGLTPVTLLLTLLLAYLLLKVQLVLVLVLLALVFATVIERPVQLLERRRVPRPLAILTVYVAIIAGLTLLFVLVAPVIRDQAAMFREQVPAQLRGLRDAWATSRNPLLNGPGQDLLGRGILIVENPGQGVSVPQEAIGVATDVASGVVGGIVGALTVLVIAFYYLMEKAWLRRLILLEIAPGARERVGRVWDNVEAKVGDWLRGQLLLCLVIGTSATLGYAILGVRFWPLLGLWAGITEIIPIVGPWLGGVPAVIIALTQSWDKALLVVGFIVLLQATENTVLVPRIMRGAVGLTPLTVFVAILAGTQFLGVLGALLAIPVAAAVQVLLTDYLDARREAKRADGAAVAGWRWMRGPIAPVPIQPVADEPRAPAASSGEPPPGTSPGRTARRRWPSGVLSRPTGSPRPDE